MSTSYNDLTDAQWETIKPHLPPKNPLGRPRADDRKTLNGIMYILRTGTHWRELPKRYGDDSTVHRRLKQWHEEGVWTRIWQAFLSNLDQQEGIDWNTALMDGTFVPSKGGALKLPMGARAKVRPGTRSPMPRVYL